MAKPDLPHRSTSGGGAIPPTDSNGALAAILDGLDAAVYVADMDSYEVLYANQRVRDRCGDVTGEPCWKALQKNQSGPCSFCTNQHLVDERGEPRGAHVWEFENPVDHKKYRCHDQAIRWPDGRLVRLEVATPITNSAGDALRLTRNPLGATTDLPVAGLADADSALRESEDRYRLLFDSAPDGIQILDSDGLITACSKSAETLYGFTQAEMIGKHVTRLMTPASVASFREKFPMLQRLEPQEGEIQVVRKDGAVVDVWRKGIPLTGPDGQLGGVLAYDRDITERKSAEEQLRKHRSDLEDLVQQRSQQLHRNEVELSAIYHNAPLPMLLIDRKGRVRKANAMAEAFSQTADAEVVGQLGGQVLRCIHAYDDPQGCGFGPECRSCVVRNTVLETFRTRQNHHAVEAPIPRDTNGGVLTSWVLLSTSFLDLPEGDRVLVSMEDITARRSSEEAVHRASRMEATATLAGGIAHDFNNLMVGVLGGAEMLREMLPEGPQAQDLLAMIAASAKRAGELAQQMLAYARGGRYLPLPINLNDAIEDAMQLQERTIPPHIRLQRDYAPDLWNVIADQSQISQVLMNLCINAAEAIEDQGEIVISTRNFDADDAFAKAHTGLAAGRHVCLCVKDTGCGMDADTKKRLFEPFFSTKFQGRGLGMAAAYGIVKNHDGHIAVDSKKGSGTSVRVYLPATDTVLEAPGKPRKLTPRGTETVLVIDDEEMVRNMTSQMLERQGYLILTASDGHAALELAREHEGEIDLALLDMGMPGLGGAAVFPSLMKLRPDLKVIICSGYELDTASRAMLDAGACAFIQKPFRVADLLHLVRRTIDT